MLIKSKLGTILKRKYLIMLYFVLFILLNIADFLGWLTADLDFFKKILSWILIWILFYQVSFTKIFIGKKIPLYDILYILGFSLLVVPRLLVHYLTLIKEGLIFNGGEFIIFGFIINSLKYIFSLEQSLISAIILGIVIIVVTNISLLSNNGYFEKSFIGSLNLHPKTRVITSQITLFFLSFFFAFIISPFFLEWFALSVDALVLVLGLLYYLIQFYYHHLGEDKLPNLLREISNTGSTFFKSIIESFSHKNTFFVGVSFLLALLLLVDIGVYMVPYLVGTNSQLYFSALGEETHVPLFNVFTFENSRSYGEVTEIFESKNTTPLLLKLIQFLFVVLLYISTYLFFLLLLIFPFYYIYKRIHLQELNLSKVTIFFILSMSILYLISTVFLSIISMPLAIGFTEDIRVKGVDITTQSIFSGEIGLLNFSDTLSLLMFLVLFTILFIFLRFEKYKSFFKKITYSVLLLFFFSYIMIFYIDYNQEFFTQSELDKKEISIVDFSPYVENYVFGNLRNEVSRGELQELSLENELLVTGRIYSNEEISFFYGKYEIITNLENLEENKNVNFIDENIIINLPNKNTITQSYNLGKEVFQETTLVDQTRTSFFNFLIYINFFFSTIFYVFGILVFSKHYLKTVLFRRP